MNLEISAGQIAGIIIGGIALQSIAAGILFNVFRARATDWHEDNQRRFTKIEKALGIDDPDDTAFLRHSDAERMRTDNEREHTHIWSELGNHDIRIKNLEK